MAAEGQTPAEVILSHVRDGSYFELPGADGLASHYSLPEPGSWVLFGLDITPTRHAVIMWIAAALVMLVGWLASRGRGNVLKGRLQTGFEMLFLFIRDEMARANIH